MNSRINDIVSYLDKEDLEFFKSLQKVKIHETEIKVDTCAICYSNQRTIFEAPLQCGHRFHAECIGEWLKYQKKCPFCDSEVPDN